jgi:MFS transporter, SP family, solute carrier family 2 (facilitated glucose transporter), member 3
MGTFRFRDDPSSGPATAARPRSYSVSADGSSLWTPTQMGRQELYRGVPFAAVFGLQRKERSISQAFADYAAGLDADNLKDLPEAERHSRMSRASMMILDELEFEANVVTVPLVFAIVVAAACQFLVGYNTGVMNAPEHVVFPAHSTLSWSLAVAAFAVGGPFGAITGGRLADRAGRRGALLIDVWTFLLGGLLQTMALDMVTIIVSRFVIGFASGFSSVLVPIYLGEMAPPTLRGMLGTVTQFAMVIGILAADLFAFPLATEWRWRFLFAVTPLVAVIQLILAPFLLESPRWLLARDPKSLKARYIIKRLRGLRYDHEVETEVGNFVIGGDAQKQEQTSQMAVLQEMLGQPKIRALLLSSVVLQLSQQLSGINAVFYYSTSFFEGIIDNPLVGTTIVGAVNVLATWLVLLLMDRCGRRTLILWSSGGMFISCIVIVLSLLGFFGNITALVAVNAYVAFFEVRCPVTTVILKKERNQEIVCKHCIKCGKLTHSVCYYFDSSSVLGPFRG